MIPRRRSPPRAPSESPPAWEDEPAPDTVEGPPSSRWMREWTEDDVTKHGPQG